ncbi:MAG: hypothetical protein OXD42_10180 [Rhodospirillaceae bacterium]|nr:hypothetical protein [Rhodospirillaceae bacterium]
MTIPTSVSRMNAVEGVFSRVSRQRLRNAVFDSLVAFLAAIEGTTNHHKAYHARPFRWSRKPEDRVEAGKRGHQKLQEKDSK